MKEGLAFHQERIAESSTQDEECNSGVRFARLELGFHVISCWLWIFRPHLPYVEGLTVPNCGRDRDASIMQFHLHPAFLGCPKVRRDYISDLWMIRGGGSNQIPLSGLPKTFLWPSTSSLPFALKLQDGRGASWKGCRSQRLRLKGEPWEVLPVRTHAPESAWKQKQSHHSAGTAYCNHQPILMNTAPQRRLEHLQQDKKHMINHQ